MVHVGTVVRVLQLASQIKEAVHTVKSNKQICETIQMRAKRVSAMLSNQVDTPLLTTQLKNLDKAMDSALKLIAACQQKSSLYHLITSRSIRKQLRKANKDMMSEIATLNFSKDLHHTVKFITITKRYQAGAQSAPLKYGGKVESSQGSQSTDDTRKGRIGAFTSGFRNFTTSELQAATNNFSCQNLIGQGGFTTVYKGVLNDKLVAVKIFNRTQEEKHISCLVDAFLLLLPHENVVDFLGYCHDDKHDMVVEAYMSRGSLSQIINGSSKKLDWSSTLGVFRGLAKGIAHLHAKRVVHLDLKPDNILFDSAMNVKIADFGISEILEKGVIETMTDELAGTIGYMPPEYVADGKISFKHDVYSFGVIILRTLSAISRPGLRPDAINWALEVRAAQGMNQLFDPSFCEESQLQDIERCIEIGLLCIEMDPVKRPSMSDALEMLNKNDNSM